jgi:hypothetical protein
MVLRATNRPESSRILVGGDVDDALDLVPQRGVEDLLRAEHVGDDERGGPSIDLSTCDSAAKLTRTFVPGSAASSRQRRICRPARTGNAGCSRLVSGSAGCRPYVSLSNTVTSAPAKAG